MLKTEIYLVLGLVFVCVGAQQRPPIRPPRPPSVSGSYSDYPGLLVNANPSQSNRPKNVQNNNLRANIPKESSSSNVDRTNSGPIVIPAASSSYSSLPSQEPPQSALPSRTTSYSDSPKSAQGIPVSVVAAAELAQQYEKPVAPVKTGTDTWTPMGFTGDGKSFDMPTTAIPAQVKNKPVEVAPSATAQPVPYDSTKSQQTIGQQIIERQQKQQQQQQYDIFGFPIDNSPDPFASLFGMAPSNDGLFGSMFSTSPDPFFGSFGGAVGGQNTARHGGSGQPGFGGGNNMLQMMLMMQLLGDAPDPQPRTRGRRGPGAPSSPMSALEQLFRMEEMRMRRQQQLANRNRRHPSQRYGQQGPSQQNRYRPAGNTAPRIPKPSRTKSAVVLTPGSAPRRPAPARQSLHPEVLDRRNMPTTPAPATQGQEPVEREGPASAAPNTQRQPSHRQNAIERHSINRNNYAQRGSGHASQYRDHTPQYKQASQMPYNEPAMSYHGQTNANFGQSYNAYPDPYHTGSQQQSQSQSIPPPPPPPQRYRQQPNQYHQQPNDYPIATRDSRRPTRNFGPNAVPRNIQQLVNNPLFQRRLRTAGATPGANPADVQADRADLMADRADNLQSISPFERMMGMAMTGARGGSSQAGLSPLTNMFGSAGTAGSPFGFGMFGI